MSGREAVDPWHVLGVRPGASSEEVRRAYLKMVRLHHPDLYGSDEGLRRGHEQVMKEINAAYSQINQLPGARRPTYTARQHASAMATHCQEHGRWVAIYCTYCGRALCSRCDPSLSGVCRDHRKMH